MIMMISPILVHHKTFQWTHSSHRGSAWPSNQKFINADNLDDDDNYDVKGE